jgi:hypothetical protein
MDDNDEHSLKQMLLIEVTVFGIGMDDNDKHRLKKIVCN